MPSGPLGLGVFGAVREKVRAIRGESDQARPTSIVHNIRDRIETVRDRIEASKKG